MLGSRRPNVADWLPAFGQFSAATGVLIAAGALFSQVTSADTKETAADAAQVLVLLRLPAVEFWMAEIVASRKIEDQTIQAFVYYSDHQHILLGFARNGRPFLTSNPIPINYRRIHELDITWEAPESNSPHRRFKLVINNRLVLNASLPAALKDIVDDPRSIETQLTVDSDFSGNVFERKANKFADLRSNPPSASLVSGSYPGQ
jgi:hypothetical protein